MVGPPVGPSANAAQDSGERLPPQRQGHPQARYQARRPVQATPVTASIGTVIEPGT